MTGPVTAFLARDHARLDALLRRAAANPALLDRSAYEEFRARLLRHIAMEEKVLPEVEDLASRLQAVPAVPVAPHFDGPRVHAQIARLLSARTNTKV